jgi:cardiolipin synthase
MRRTRVRKAHSGAALVAAASETFDHVRSEFTARPWWYNSILVLGFVTLLTAVAVLFFGVNNAPDEIATNEQVAPVQSPDFLAALSRLVGAPAEQGGAVEILNNGDEFLPALVQSINDARHSVNFSVYIWEDGAFSDQVLDALIRKQSQGVPVRVILDGLGGRKAPGDRFGELEKLGGRVEKFRTPKFGSWTRFHRRNHRRSIVIDGRIGFTGGMAVGDKWLGHAQDPDHWRDIMFKLTGPLASSLQGAFVDAWASSSGEILVGPGIVPVATAPGTSAAGVERFIHHINSPADDDHSMAYFYLLSIFAARDRVWITTPYFIPDQPLQHALEAKARAGVDVRLLLPGSHIDNHTVRLSAQSRYQALLDAGVKIYEYQPTFSHHKYMVVDGRWSLVGSANLDSRSRQLDEENVFGILDSRLGRQLEDVFTADLRHSTEIKPDEWRRRNPVMRILQVASRILDQQS